ncbi:MLP-like protein 28 [Prunus dulcis]|uniref:MLP-like protein 28 n=1 Tax=Prunus dulcis TaxID=3755 RepID=A0A5H2XUG3_PRUDU|nr:MLP-like protein 28 [Prunus dulcis]
MVKAASSIGLWSMRSIMVILRTHIPCSSLQWMCPKMSMLILQVPRHN